MRNKSGLLFACAMILGLSLPAVRAVAQSPQSTADADMHVTAPSNIVKHPDVAHGPKHFALGVIKNASCSYPSVLEFKLQGAKKTLTLYSNNFAQIDLTALGITISGAMNPCQDFEGKKARIQYAETTDKTVDGQVIAIELRK